MATLQFPQPSLEDLIKGVGNDQTRLSLVPRAAESFPTIDELTGGVLSEDTAELRLLERNGSSETTTSNDLEKILGHNTHTNYGSFIIESSTSDSSSVVVILTFNSPAEDIQDNNAYIINFPDIKPSAINSLYEMLKGESFSRDFVRIFQGQILGKGIETTYGQFSVDIEGDVLKVNITRSKSLNSNGFTDNYQFEMPIGDMPDIFAIMNKLQDWDYAKYLIQKFRAES